jgi:hypothetical protein
LFFSILWCNQTSWNLKSQTNKSIWWRGIHWFEKMKFIIFYWFSMKKIILNLITFALLVKNLQNEQNIYQKVHKVFLVQVGLHDEATTFYINHNNSYNQLTCEPFFKITLNFGSNLQKLCRSCSLKHKNVGLFHPLLHGFKLQEKKKWYHLALHFHTSIQNV